MPISNKWINYGNANPREHGGIFVRFNPKNKTYEIIQTTPMADYDGFDFSYLFEHAIVKGSALKKDKALQSFAGYTGNVTKSELSRVAASYFAYYDPDENAIKVNNYWGELKNYGIYASILGKR